MKRNLPWKQILLAAFEIIFFVLYAHLRILNAQSIRSPRISFGDTKDYLLIASHSLLSSSFWLSDRPVFTPLFFKIFGGNPHTIFLAQLYFSLFSWGILAVVCAHVIRSYPLKFVAFTAVLGFSLSQQVILWDSLLLSESLHFSLMALFYSAGFLILKRWSRPKAIVLIVIAVLVAFTRDPNAYMLLMAGIILVFLTLFKKNRRRFLLIGGSFIAIFLASYIVSSVSDHAYKPLLQSIGLRILPNQEYLGYFKSLGMPVTYILLEHSGHNSQWNGLSIAQDPRLAPFRTWVKEHGTLVFAKFLWQYKADTLQKPLNNPEAVLAPNLYYYSATGFVPILEKSPFSEILYPMNLGVIVFWMANMLAAFTSAFALQRKRILWLLPLLMILLAYPMIVLIWNTDADDLLRHSLHLNVQWRLGLWLLILLLIDYLMEELAPKLKNFVRSVFARKNHAPSPDNI